MNDTCGDPAATPEWQALTSRLEGLPTLASLVREPGRFEASCLAAPHMRVDFSRQRWTEDVRNALIALALARGLDVDRTRLFEANDFNPTERRAVLHTLLRAPENAADVHHEGMNLSQAVRTAHARMREIVDAVRSGRWRGHTGKTITNVVNIGIGGSFLGPALICDALGTPTGPRPHFIANIDGTDAQRALSGLDPERTLFLIASKSFGTLETKVNAQTARAWFIERGGRSADIPRHFLAVSTNVAAAAEFGLPEENLLPMWDWVGGRFSMWSPIGFPIAVAFGNEALDGMRRGAAEMDTHFRTAPLGANVPLLIALAEIWNRNFLEFDSHVVLPYATALDRLPDYLQQLEMESNGKSVRIDGETSRVPTAPVLWGNVGTNGQHAFHQLLHQGTARFSAQFVMVREPDHDLDHHHTWLTAHGLAQAAAFASGKPAADVQNELQASGVSAADAATQAAHRAIEGGHPSTIVMLDALTPAALGALIALHEHKVFAQGRIWGINSFDQWGVELGKRLGDTIHDALARPADAAPVDLPDAATAAMVQLLRND